MYFVAFALDYDGTLALDGKVDARTLESLRLVKETGRKLILVSGRELPDLQSTFDELEIFDLAVLENGGLLYNPKTCEKHILTATPSPDFIERLKELGVAPLSIGDSIVATWQPHETAVLQAISELGLDLQIIFNKGAVMILPSGVNKASGLSAALDRLGLSCHNVVAIGDAENDIAFLKASGCSAAVANAIDSVKAIADFHVADHGKGVQELARYLIDSDLQIEGKSVPKARPILGTDTNGKEIAIDPLANVMIMGSSGGGKTTTVTAILEQFSKKGLQYCIIDPEGDYSEIADVVTIGDIKTPPSVEEAIKLLDNPAVNGVVNLLAVDLIERPAFLRQFLLAVGQMRATLGRPHWLILDEIHHFLPAATGSVAVMTLPAELPSIISVTVDPYMVAKEFLDHVSTVIGVGAESIEAIGKFNEITGRTPPQGETTALERGHVHLARGDEPIRIVKAVQPTGKRRRHARKYAQGDLTLEQSFFFRGPDNALNLRANNLMLFMQMAEGVDDATWMYHLKRGDYSAWFREVIKDPGLADDAEQVEQGNADAQATRDEIKKLIDTLYTAPAKG